MVLRTLNAVLKRYSTYMHKNGQRFEQKISFYKGMLFVFRLIKISKVYLT